MNATEAGRLPAPAAAVRALAGRIAGADPAILLLAAPFLLYPGRWAPALAAVLALPWLARRISRGAFTVPTPATIPLTLIVLMGGVGLAVSVDPQVSLEAFWRLLLGVAVFFSLANAFPGRQDLRWLSAALVLAGLGLIALTLLGTRWQAVRLAALPQIYNRLPSLVADPVDNHLFNPRVMGMALAIDLAALAGLALLGEDRRVRAAAGFVALLMALVLPLTQALQALLALGAGLGFLALWRSRWFLLLLVPAGGLAGWLLTRLDLRGLALQMIAPGDVAGIGVALRLDMWGRALAMVRDLPFTGIGLNLFPQIQTNFYPGFLLGPEPHAHSLFLQLALDLGLPGLIGFLWLTAAAASMCVAVCRRAASRDERALALGAMAGICAYLGAGLIDSPWTPKPGILLWLLLGALAAVYARVTGRDTPAEHARTRRFPAHATALLAGAALAGALLLILPGIRERNLGALEAHRALFALRSGAPAAPSAIAAAEKHLQAASTLGAGNAQVHSLLGSLHAWSGEDDAALAAFTRQIALDGLNPMAEYAPFEALRRRITGDPGSGAAVDLLRVYGQWQIRYPARAEPFVTAALVQNTLQGRPDLAAATLAQAEKNGAWPATVVGWARQRLGEAH
ncbi:MAG TPA: O-antigen ligase family protein [Anaerolineae bacterium]